MKKILFILITTLIMSITTGCTNKDTPTEQDPFIVNAYKVLDTSAIVYNTTMQISSDAAKEGLLDSDQYDRIKNAAQIWYTSYQSSVIILENYYKAADANKKNDVIAAIESIKIGIKQLIVVAKSFGLKVPEYDDSANELIYAE
nr:MAG TPA: protein of unknown function (DUF4969) [Caudoviricetes sp.]